MVIDSIVNQRSTWPTLTGPIALASLPAYVNALEADNTEPHLTGLTRTGEWRFTGADQTTDNWRPQGIAVKDGVIITQWKSQVSPTDRQKIVLVDPAQGSIGMWRNLGLLAVGGGGKFNHIVAAVGGIGVAGDYLYVSSNFAPKSFRVFDLRECYELAANSSAVDPADSLANLYPYFLPQVGEIFVTPPDSAGLGWFGIHGGVFLAGNFYDESLGFTLGGRSMVWKCPITTQGGVEFPIFGTTTQIEPLFPASAAIGTTITRIQGALISGNALVLSRSWSAATKSLIVLNLSDPMNQFFVGTDGAPTTHHEANWLFGCEGVSGGIDADSMVTVTEFTNTRNISQFDLAEVRALVGATLGVAGRTSALNTVSGGGGLLV